MEVTKNFISLGYDVLRKYRRLAIILDSIAIVVVALMMTVTASLPPKHDGSKDTVLQWMDSLSHIWKPAIVIFLSAGLLVVLFTYILRRMRQPLAETKKFRDRLTSMYWNALDASSINPKSSASMNLTNDLARKASARKPTEMPTGAKPI